MKKHIFLFSVSLVLQFSVEAQTIERQAVAAAGKYSANSQLSLSYTIGEANSASLFSPSIVLTQGFQQPAAATVSTGPDLQKQSFSIFPNPASSNFSLNYQLNSASASLIEVFNAAGQLVCSRKCEAAVNGTQTFRCADWASGTYSVRMSQSGQNLFTSKFQIIR